MSWPLSHKERAASRGKQKKETHKDAKGQAATLKYGVVERRGALLYHYLHLVLRVSLNFILFTHENFSGNQSYQVDSLVVK